ncbi:hypothetical protein ACLBX9_03685 [Methylobacterium sp. A49B]|nr:hypothetical protein [Methylobacterium mesophilicum]
MKHGGELYVPNSDAVASDGAPDVVARAVIEDFVLGIEPAKSQIRRL